MYLLISVLIIIASILLILIVLAQSSKGGLASGFSGSAQVMGVRKTADFLEKATWSLAIGLLVLCLLASLTIPRQEAETNRSIIEEQINNAVNPNAMPNFPTTVPSPQENTEQKSNE